MEAYCWRCDSFFKVNATPEEIKERLIHDECSCGKSGAFSLVTPEEKTEVLLRTEKEKQ